jgi:NADP-dependent 3-hydroxy acid dehydrogenase YdfG
MSKVVLITGCSTGIGNDLARRLALYGYTVVASARRAETLANLPCALKLPLDVTQPESINRVVECILQRFGRIDVLVNNAGYAVCGAVEEVPVEQVQRMFDANVFGVMRMIQAVVPHMRRQNEGWIINISSVAGKLVLPVNGTYSATKFALEALSDALRLELEPFGIRVSLIEPGAIKTNFDQTVQTHARQIFCNPASPYLSLYRQYQHVSDTMRVHEHEPEVVSRAVQQAIELDRPKARYLAGFSFSGKLVLLLGDPVWEFVRRYMFDHAPAVALEIKKER